MWNRELWWWVMADLTLLLILVVLLARGGAEPPSQYCGRNTPLQTQYFSSFLQEEQHAIGRLNFYIFF